MAFPKLGGSVEGRVATRTSPAMTPASYYSKGNSVATGKDDPRETVPALGEVA